ncbi:MAG: hypothetical protein AB1306_07960 [Nitrospirota bacterium]
MNANEKRRTILDHIDNISVPGDVFSKPSNEYWALICLREGLEFLYSQVVQIDKITQSILNPEGKKKYVSSGNGPGTVDIPKPLLTCSFHWYAVSACQYVLTVGAIACKQDNSRPIPRKYVEAVIPGVKAFRDKVAAHFAWNSKHSQDNDAERLASIIPPLSFVEDSWHVGVMQIAMSKGGKLSTSESIRPWSITKIHDDMTRRYWPH